MVLVLVVHSLEAVSATVPICMIALKEAVDRRALPEDLKIRQVAEDFTYGLAAELQRIRTAEKIAAQSRKTAGTVAEKTKATFRAAGHKVPCIAGQDDANTCQFMS
eukprot:evm.model.scf_1697.5 EVM.evm.TU.scf_1697.5   scf_1697:32276-34793(+)